MNESERVKNSRTRPEGDRSRPREHRRRPQKDRSRPREHRRRRQKGRSRAEARRSDPRVHRGHPNKCRSSGDECRSHRKKARSVPNFYPGHTGRDRSRPKDRRSGPRRDRRCSKENRGRPEESRPDPREHGVIPNEIRIRSTQIGLQSKGNGVRSEDIGALQKISGVRPKRIGLVAKNTGARQRSVGLAKEDRSPQQGNRSRRNVRRSHRMFVGVIRNSIGGIPSSATPFTPARGISNIRPGITRRDRAASRIQWACIPDGPDSIRRPPETTVRSARGQRRVPRPRQHGEHCRSFPRRACKREACSNPLINPSTKEVAGILIYKRGTFFRVVATCRPNHRDPDEAETSSSLPPSASKRHGPGANFSDHVNLIYRRSAAQSSWQYALTRRR